MTDEKQKSYYFTHYGQGRWVYRLHGDGLPACPDEGYALLRVQERQDGDEECNALTDRWQEYLRGVTFAAWVVLLVTLCVVAWLAVIWGMME